MCNNCLNNNNYMGYENCPIQNELKPTCPCKQKKFNCKYCIEMRCQKDNHPSLW